MRQFTLAMVVALSSMVALAAPPAKLTHKDGSTTTVSGNKESSRATGWYGGDGLHANKSKAEMVKEVKQAGKDKGNPVIKVEHAK